MKTNLLLTLNDRQRTNLLYFFCFFFFALLLAERIAIVFSYHGQLAGIDNNFPYPVMCMLNKMSIYPDPENYPFAVNPYAPVFFYVSYAVCLLFGVQAADTIQIYFVTRGVCLLSDLLMLYVLYRVLRRYMSIGKPMAFLAVVCFFYVVSYWGYTMNRSDSLLLLCFAGTVSYLLSYLQKATISKLLLLAVICNLGIFSKQNAIILPAVAGTVLLYNRRFKDLFIFTISFGVLFAGCMLLFTQLYPHGAFVAHLAKALQNKIDPRWFYINIFKRLAGGFVILPLAAGIFLAGRWLLKGETPAKTCLALTALITGGWAVALSFKWGSGVSYFHESLFCITALLSYVAERADFSAMTRKLSSAMQFVLAFILGHIALELFFFNINDRQADKQSYTQQQEIATSLLQELAGTDRYVFTDTDHYSDFFKSLMLGRVAAPNMDAVSCCTYPDGNFNYGKLREGFVTGKVAFILFNEGQVHSSFYDIPFNKYEYYKTVHHYVIYRFKG